MKKLFSIALILLFIISTTKVNAQTWQHKLNESSSFARGISIATVDNGYLYHNSRSFFKFDQLGTVGKILPKRTVNSFSSPTKVEGNSIGYVISSSPTRLERVDFFGNTLWEFDAPNNLSSPQIVLKKFPTFLSDNGNYYFAATDSLYVINEIDGTIMNQYSFGGGYACATIRKDNDDYAILGENLNGSYEIIQMDSSGNIQNTINVNMTAYDMVVTTDGYFVVGMENGNMTMKNIDRSGNELYSQNYGVGILHSIVQKNPDFVASGSNGTNGKLLKLNMNGTVIWSETYNDIIELSSETQVINDTKTEGFILASTSHILKTDSEGKIDTPEKDLYIDGSAILDVNNIAALANAEGSLFWDGDKAYFKTKDTDVSSIFAANFWIGGVDPAGNLKLAAGTYNTNGNDYQPGFIGGDAENMNKVWKVSKVDIKKLRADFEEDGVIDDIVPNDILTYPALNNPNAEGIKGEVILNQSNSTLDFFDYNSDGVYNVFDGDYPITKGDMDLVWFMNDDKLHAQSQAEPLQITMVCRLYGYECGGNDLINNTIFQSYLIQSESTEVLDSVFGGLWLDADLGCSTDDFFGSIPNKNSYYYYNEDAIDGDLNGNCNDVNTYTGTIPVQSVTYLNRPLETLSYYSDVFPPVSIGTIPPQTAAQYYNFMNARWGDGSPLTNAGNGYNNGSPTNHAFSGNPSNPNDWALSNLGLPSSDMRTVAMTNFGLFQPGNITELEIAYSLHRNLPSYLPNSIDLGNSIDNIQSLYDTEILSWDIYLGADKDLTIGQALTLVSNIEGGAATANYTYLWSTGETTATINATAPITYSVTVTNTQTGCTKTDEIKVKFATSTAQITTEIDKINVFPNPVKDLITIDTRKLDESDLQISIIDITGKVVQSQYFGNSDFIQVDVSNITAGVYFLKFSNAQFEKIGFKKIVVLD
jgi:hypothetical protein